MTHNVSGGGSSKCTMVALLGGGDIFPGATVARTPSGNTRWDCNIRTICKCLPKVLMAIMDVLNFYLWRDCMLFKGTFTPLSPGTDTQSDLYSKLRRPDLLRFGSRIKSFASDFQRSVPTVV